MRFYLMDDTDGSNNTELGPVSRASYPLTIVAAVYEVSEGETI